MSSLSRLTGYCVGIVGLGAVAWLCWRGATASSAAPAAVAPANVQSPAAMHEISAPPSGARPSLPANGVVAQELADAPAAARDPELTAASELDSLLLPITASGLDGALEPAAAAQAKVLAASGGKRGKVQLAETECYRDGCALTLFSSDSNALQAAADDYTESPTFFGWSGAKFRSGPIERSGGRFEVTWILYADGVMPSAPAVEP